MLGRNLYVKFIYVAPILLPILYANPFVPTAI